MIPRTDAVELRHLLHRYAERSGEEVRTAGLVRNLLAATGPDRLIEGLGGHGLLAEYRGATEGPSVLLRAELDAVPITDPPGWGHASLTEGTGHKCGHDGHMTILLRVAEEVGRRRPRVGTVQLLFQPAEETGEGAHRVLNDPAFQDIRPSWVFALHNLPGVPFGHVVVRTGAFAMASRGLAIQLRGETAHAAAPGDGRRPTPAVAELLQLLDDPPEAPGAGRTGRSTVVHAQLGEPGAFGTSPGAATLHATLRAHTSEDIDRRAAQQLTRIREIAARHDLAADVTWHEEFPATWNDARAARLVESAALSEGLVVVKPDEPFGWSEDFGHFTATAPGALFGLGAGADHPQLHTPRYDFPDPLIEPAVRLFLRLAGIAADLAPPDDTP
jgi:amidohydrolase